MSFSSFRRKNANQPKTPIGCKVSTQNAEILLSCGVPSLDDIIGGGGIPLNSLTLLKSDRYTGYATLLLKYFMSQGLSSQQPIILVSMDESPEILIKNLPFVVSENLSNEQDDGGDVDEQLSNLSIRAPGRVLGATRSVDADQMRIAWRYNALPKVSSQLGTTLHRSVSSVPYCSLFDITKQRDVEEPLKSGAVQCLSEDNLEVLYEQILELLTNGGFLESQTSSNPEGRHVARIVIHQFASASWDLSNLNNFIKFFIKLRRLVQRSFAVCLISIPAYSYNDFYGQNSHWFVELLQHISDCCLEIESFVGTSRKLHSAYTNPPPSSPQYHGLIHPIKLPCLKVLVPAVQRLLSPSQLRSLAFRVRRKRFAVETFHLPPDDGIEDDNNLEGDSMTKEISKTILNRQVGGGCASGSSNKSKLDF